MGGELDHQNKRTTGIFRDRYREERMQAETVDSKGGRDRFG